MRNVRGDEGIVHLIEFRHEEDDTCGDFSMYVVPRCKNDGFRLYIGVDDLTDDPATCLKCVAGDEEPYPF